MLNLEFKQKSYKLSIITYITYEFKQEKKGSGERERKKIQLNSIRNHNG